MKPNRDKKEQDPPERLFRIDEIISQGTNPSRQLTEYRKKICRRLNISPKTEERKRKAVTGSPYLFNNAQLMVVQEVLREVGIEVEFVSDLLYKIPLTA